jgi:hypothetical protein
MDRATMHVVPDDGAILEEVAQTEEQVLREVGYRNYKQRARLINHPGVVRFNIRHFRRHTEPAVAHLLDPHFNGFDRGFESSEPSGARSAQAGESRLSRR